MNKFFLVLFTSFFVFDFSLSSQSVVNNEVTGDQHIQGNIFLPYDYSFVAGEVPAVNQGNRMRLFHNGNTAFIDYFPTLNFRQGDRSMSHIMTLNSSGNVGINILNPESKLHVVGDVRINFNYALRANNETFTYENMNVPTYGLQWKADNFESVPSLWLSGYGGIKLFTENKPRLTIRRNGNIGIGTENPQEKLTVNGNVSIPYNNYLLLGPSKNSDTAYGIRMIHNGTNAIIDYRDNIFFRTYATGGNTVIALNKGGYVGLGISSPQERLHIKNGHLRMEENFGFYFGEEASFTHGSQSMFSNGLRFNRDNQENIYKLWFSGNNGIKFFTNNAPRLVINKEGKIGIGTESPQYQLEVNGTIRAKEVKIETGWADFVFAPDYELPSLRTVENHIKEHRHLPGIPTESEVKENGVNLGEMQVKLLQKIEELTLYMIEQDKKIETLTKTIEELTEK